MNPGSKICNLSGRFNVTLKVLALTGAALVVSLASCTVSREPLATQLSPKATLTPSLQSPQTVTLKTLDGWTIVGDLYLPIGATRGEIVLLHQRGGSATDWQTLARALQQAGFIALAIDQRGTGRSIQGSGATGSNAPWLTINDIAAAIASLPKQKPIGLIGASYGANNALIYAAEHPDQVQGVALLSPGANYNGLDAIAAARSYPGTLMIYHAQEDAIAGDGPEQINRVSSAKSHELKLLKGSAHGTELVSPEVVVHIVTYFTDRGG